MATLLRQRCLVHVEREAVARCPECGQFYCRECITEHDDRVICAACLRASREPAAKKRLRLPGAGRLLRASLGALATWLLFYQLGRLLLLIPSEFHDGSMWRRLDP